jgi:hypothetical protein
MTILPWPEVTVALHEKLGYVGGGNYDMSGDALVGIVAAGFDLMIKHPSDGGMPVVQVSPKGRGFTQR